MGEQNQDILCRTDESGSISIAEDVIASIAALAATEVEGVLQLVGNLTNELIAMLGVKNYSKGVKISVEEKEVNVSLSIVMKYGYNIPEVSAAVQERVRTMVENMTGLKVVSVLVKVSGVGIKETEESSN